jgi:hypothetical protein
MATISEAGNGGVDLDEAARELGQAAHDAQVAYDCLALGDIERARIHAITARTACDAAENVLRVALGDGMALGSAGTLAEETGR